MKGGEYELQIFELSKKKTKNGRRKFKMLLYQIFSDECIDEQNEIGTQYNENGITWIREYCEKALPSIKGMSLRCEFLDEERTELCGHGETGIVDGLPIFENAVVIGTFDDGYIEDVTLPDGNTITACIGVGTIDGCCYHNFCEKLDQDLAEGIFPSGSVEILKTDGNDGIVYKYGYKELGRIPTVFEHSGFALIGVRPADPAATILELNNNNNNNNSKKEDIVSMNELEIKVLIDQAVEAYSSRLVELNQCKDECDRKVNEANAKVETIEAEKNAAIADADKIKEALEACQKERDEAYQKIDNLWEEMRVLKEELAKAQAEKRVGELNSALSAFSDEEKAYAQVEIDAFNENPIESEINSVISKIYEGIGKKAKDDAEKISHEQNAAHEDVEDIFGEVIVQQEIEDTNIF